MKSLIGGIAIAGAVLVNSASAQAPAQGTAPHRTPEEQRNLGIAVDFFANVIQKRDVDRFKEFVAPTFIEHNPNLAGNLASLESRFREIIQADPKGELKPLRIVAQAVEDDLVILVIEKGEVADPKDPAKKYVQLGVEVVRLKDGKQVEHWDEKMRVADAAKVRDAAAKP